jgi:hypothetical protein
MPGDGDASMTKLAEVAQAVRDVQIPIMRGEDMVGVQQIPRSMAEVIARAAIKALRQPNDAMIEAGVDAAPNPRDIWDAMIDAALAEVGEPRP